MIEASSWRIAASRTSRSPRLRIAVGGAGRWSPPASGGTRTCWPAASRVEVWTRPPSTRTWPERISFCRWPKPRPGKCSLNQRSSRIPASSRSTRRLSTALMQAPHQREPGDEAGHRPGDRAADIKAARPACPRSQRSTVSSEKAEKVVKPPRSPVVEEQAERHAPLRRGTRNSRPRGPWRRTPTMLTTERADGKAEAEQRAAPRG